MPCVTLCMLQLTAMLPSRRISNNRYIESDIIVSGWLALALLELLVLHLILVDLLSIVIMIQTRTRLLSCSAQTSSRLCHGNTCSNNSVYTHELMLDAPEYQ